MKDVSFIPARRLAERRRRRRVRRWAIAVGAHAVVLVATYAVCRNALAGEPGPPQESVDALASRIQRKNGVIAALRGTVTAEEGRLQAARAVGEQPDWSILLALLSESLDDQVVLRQCQLKPEQPAPGKTGEPSPAAERGAGGAFVLHVAGYGQTQAAVARYILQLEQSGLFDKVHLLKTTREPFLAGTAVAFQIDCSIIEGVRPG